MTKTGWYVPGIIAIFSVVYFTAKKTTILEGLSDFIVAHYSTILKLIAVLVLQSAIFIDNNKLINLCLQFCKDKNPKTNDV